MRPGDEKVVAAAFAGRAAFVVTLDRHLLELGGLVGVQVLRPGDFLRQLRTIRRKLWTGGNQAAAVPRARVPKRLPK